MQKVTTGVRSGGKSEIQKLLFSLHEGAEMLSCNYWTLFRMVKAGKIRTVRIGSKSLRIPLAEINRLAGIEVTV